MSVQATDKIGSDKPYSATARFQIVQASIQIHCSIQITWTAWKYNCEHGGNYSENDLLDSNFLLPVYYIPWHDLGR